MNVNTRHEALMDKQKEWEQIGKIFDLKQGCLGCPNYQKFSIYRDLPTTVTSYYCTVLANMDSQPEDCPIFKEGIQK